MMFRDSIILITGGTGSWGNVLTSKLLKKDVKQIIIFSRGELQQVLMQRKFKNDPRIKFIIGDIRDFDAINRACIGVDYIFHLAALKHVPVCEDQPQEAIKTNIIGTTNLVNAAIQNKVKKVIDVSTDKACEPLNLYGMTKSVGERLVIQANNLSDYTKFVCIRGGNVMGSNGSVIPFFKQMIESGGPLTITDVRMTRFFLTLDEAIDLLFKASEAAFGGETFVMKMPSCYISELANVLIESYDKNIEIKEIGMRPGEKLHEVLVSKHESADSYIFDDNYFVILPTLKIPSNEEHYNFIRRTFKKMDNNEFASNTIIMKKEDILNMLKKGGFIS